jgi:UDP-GlcNAc3NAcA epimerase
MLVLTVVGARPQFIKAAPVSRALHAAGHRELIVHTGQHYDDTMSRRFFDELAIPDPFVNLGVGSASHAIQTAEMLRGLEPIMQRERPDWVLVYGDTNSTLAASVAASKLDLRIAHVEAGLRSFNRRMPEEVNRIVSDVLATVLFAPTTGAVEQLRREGVAPDRIHLVGDVMYDAALMFGAHAARTSDAVASIGVVAGGYVLATIHRAENTDDEMRLHAIIGGLRSVASAIPVVLPLHPRTRHRLQTLGMLDSLKSTLHVIDPVGYLDMLALERRAAVIATDSGGVQKEAFFFGVPCVTLRDETEWTELVTLGWNRLCPPNDPELVASSIRATIGQRGERGSPYGDGRASQRIAASLAGVEHDTTASAVAPGYAVAASKTDASTFA